ncbi:hypothetical protein R1sor_019358 [Riccia sorocarpa]|uniref:Ubiquitin-like domain-containing protein n=1 Tax=Riccia sorocarpa TaxID=122646 RepID=A0ABD3IGG2_9MARC
MEDGVSKDKKEISITVKYGTNSYAISVSSNASVKDLMGRLQELTNILPRGQKLIFKGKVLDPESTLAAVKVTNGAKLMLVASEGVQQGGSSSSTKSAKSVLQSKFKSVIGSISVPKIGKTIEKGRIGNWQATGIVSLRESRIQTVPKDVWALGASVRILDLSLNSIKALSPEIGSFTNLQKLRLSNNGLTDSSISWQSLSSLKALSSFAVDHNKLTSLPAEIGQLTSLKHLDASHNQIQNVPDEIGNCSLLEKIDVSHNQLSSLPLQVYKTLTGICDSIIKVMPGSLGQCTHLSEVDFSANFLKDVPSSLSKLLYLKVLNLDNNALTNFPGEILSGCLELITLSVHGNEITVEKLRETEGWPEFDRRRKSKYTKQIDFNVIGSSNGFDEGADPEKFSHW